MSLSGTPHESTLQALRHHASWLMAFGVVLILLGILALASVLNATLATVFYVGLMMLIGGLAEIFIAFQARSWSRFAFWMAMGLFSAFAGLLTFSNPNLAAGILTLMLGISLIVSGILRIYLSFHLQARSPWGVMSISGALTMLVGLMILSQWPTSSLYALGLFLGIDLIFVGVSWVNVGWTLRRMEAE